MWLFCLLDPGQIQYRAFPVCALDLYPPKSNSWSQRIAVGLRCLPAGRIRRGCEVRVDPGSHAQTSFTGHGVLLSSARRHPSASRRHGIHTTTIERRRICCKKRSRKCRPIGIYWLTGCGIYMYSVISLGCMHLLVFTVFRLLFFPFLCVFDTVSWMLFIYMFRLTLDILT